MLSDFCVKFEYVGYTYISRVYAVDTIKSKFLVTYDDENFTWIDISECEPYDPIFEDDYDDY